MIITRLTGGLGNQMFQYAFGLELATRHKTELKLDISSYSNPALNIPPRTYDLYIFNVTATIASEAEIRTLAKRVNHDLTDRLLNRVLGVKATHIREPHFHFSQDAFGSPDNVYLNGYWQSDKYFRAVECQLRQEFTFRDPPCESARRILDKIENSESVCVHVRRGDFVTNPFNGLYGKEYYDAGAEIISKTKSGLSFFVFSDDIPWCRENLAFDGETVFVEDEFEPVKFRDDLRLMAACKHFIIANSSFSWWAAWLNNGADKIVVAPSRWATPTDIDKSDMYLPGWIKI
jgi:hypothetical protein